MKFKKIAIVAAVLVVVAAGALFLANKFAVEMENHKKKSESAMAKLLEYEFYTHCMKNDSKNLDCRKYKNKMLKCQKDTSLCSDLIKEISKGIEKVKNPSL